MKDQIKNNHHIGYLALFILLIILANCNMTWAKNPKVLVFGKTAGFAHSSIATGMSAIFKLGKENHFDVDITVDPNDFNDTNLKQYAAVIFVSATGDFFKDDAPKAALKNYIEHGGGYVGIHAATDAEYNWQWYGDLSGAYFKGHPAQQMATLNVVDSTSIATKHLPRVWKRKDEWYHFKWMAKDLHVLITIDESSLTYKPNEENYKMGAYHPMSWYHDFDGGRAFYTELGHKEETYFDPLFLKHLLGGIEYAMGRKKMQR